MTNSISLISPLISPVLPRQVLIALLSSTPPSFCEKNRTKRKARSGSDAGKTRSPLSCPPLSSIPLLLARNSNSCTVVDPFTSVIDGTANFARQFHLATQPDEGTSMTPLPGLDLRGSLLSDAHGNARHARKNRPARRDRCLFERGPSRYSNVILREINRFQPTASRCRPKVKNLRHGAIYAYLSCSRPFARGS